MYSSVNSHDSKEDHANMIWFPVSIKIDGDDDDDDDDDDDEGGNTTLATATPN